MWEFGIVGAGLSSLALAWIPSHFAETYKTKEKAFKLQSSKIIKTTATITKSESVCNDKGPDDYTVYSTTFTFVSPSGAIIEKTEHADDRVDSCGGVHHLQVNASFAVVHWGGKDEEIKREVKELKEVEEGAKQKRVHPFLVTYLSVFFFGGFCVAFFAPRDSKEDDRDEQVLVSMCCYGGVILLVTVKVVLSCLFWKQKGKDLLLDTVEVDCVGLELNAPPIVASCSPVITAEVVFGV